MPILIEHCGKRPRVHPSAYVAPNAVLSGEVVIGEHSRVLFGAVLTAEGGPVEVGAHCVIMEHAVIRGVHRGPACLGVHVLVGPHAHLTGCTVGEGVFLATGVSVFNGARIGRGAQVRINGVVHLKTVLADGALVPIGWVAVGDPARILSPHEHEQIAAVQEPLNFPKAAFGVERDPTSSIMPEITRRYTQSLALHREDVIVEAGCSTPPDESA